MGTFVGGVVGVGVFGLPFAFGQSGFDAGLLLLAVLGFAMSMLHLMFGEVVLRTKARHRLAGYVREYLGPTAGKAAFISLLFTVWGAMLAYIIVGGSFLHQLFSPLLGGPEWVYGTALAAIVLLASRRGTQVASKIEVVVVSLMLFLFVLLTLAALPRVELANFAFERPSDWTVAYGVVLFAFSGAGMVPEMRDVLGRTAGRFLASAIVTSVGVILVLYTLFSFAVLGATGANVTSSAADALITLFGSPFGTVVVLLGACTVFSVFFMQTVQLQNAFRLDGHLRKPLAWLLTTTVPLALYLAGIREFVDVVGFVGAVLSGMMGLFILATYEAMRRSVVCRTHLCLQVPSLLTIGLGIMFLVGMFLEIRSVIHAL